MSVQGLGIKYVANLQLTGVCVCERATRAEFANRDTYLLQQVLLPQG